MSNTTLAITPCPGGYNSVYARAGSGANYPNVINLAGTRYSLAFGNPYSGSGSITPLATVLIENGPVWNYYNGYSSTNSMEPISLGSVVASGNWSINICSKT